MEPALLSPRLAHAEGFTTLAYKLDGEEIITAGADSRICVFKTSPDDRDSKPLTITQHSEAVLAIAVHEKHFTTAGADGMVSVFRAQTNEFQKLLVRSTVPVRSLSYSSKGTRMAVASDEETIRVVSVDSTTRTIDLVGHKSFLKSVAFDPFDEYLLSSGCDGDVRIWDMEADGAPVCTKHIAGITTASLSDSSLLATVVWKPGGSCFAVPGKNHDIRVYSKSLWNEVYTLGSGHKGDVMSVAWSPNGRYLASIARDRKVAVWDTSKKTIVASYINSNQLCAVAWHPHRNELAFTDDQGQLTLWDDVIPVNTSSLPHPAQASQRVTDRELDKLFEDDDEPDTGLVDELAEEGSEGGDDVDMDLDDFVIDDDGAGYAEGKETHTGSRAPPQNTNLQRIQREVAMPTPFQPGETPFRNMAHPGTPREGERRYLAFNLTGVIYTIFQGTHSVVNVEFHDQSRNRNFHFTDYYNYTLAAIGEKGSVYAVAGSRKTVQIREEFSDDEDEERTEEKIVSSVLHFRPFNSWSGNTDWTVHMPEGEDVQNIAVNSVSVIASTSAGYVRLFSLSGVQTHVFRAEQIISMAATSDLAFLVYAAGPTFNDQQSLAFTLMNTESLDIMQKDKLPMAKGTELKWLGFSETSQPVISDSRSVMCVLHRQRRPGQATWIPVFDGMVAAKAKQRTERYWPVGLLRDRLMCVVLRGANEHPFFPRPMVDEAELRMPTVSGDSESDKFEEQYLRMHLMSMHEHDEAEATNTEDDYHEEFKKADIEMDKALLQLIQIACKAEKGERALDLALALHLSRSVDAAIKIAMFHHNTRLAERMTRVKETRFMSGATPSRQTPLAESQAPYSRLFESSQQSLSSDLAFLDRSADSLPPRVSKRNDLSMDEDMTQASDAMSPLPKRTRPGVSNYS